MNEDELAWLACPISPPKQQIYHSVFDAFAYDY